MSRFDECLRCLFDLEGGYSDRPGDNGGATMFGVTQVVYDEYRARIRLPQQPVKFITRSEASDIYDFSYWKPSGCNSVSAPIDLLLFDAAVNSGIGQSVKFLQRAVNVTADGIMGAHTLYALQGLNVLIVARSMLAERSSFYVQLAQDHPYDQQFLRGWLSRLTKLQKEIGV